VTLLLNVNVVLWLLSLWTGIHVKTPGNGLGPIIPEWNSKKKKGSVLENGYKLNVFSALKPGAR